MKTYNPKMSQESFKIGDKYLFLAGNKKVIGTVLDKGKTSDDILYILTDVGSHTKKFVTNNGNGVLPQGYFTPFEKLSGEIEFDGIQEVSDGVAEVKEGVTEIKKDKARGGITEVSGGGITEVKDNE